MFILIILAGMIIGSFLNVCIDRIPQGISLIRPRSTCRGCGTVLKWLDLLPVLSYLQLRGKCRYCQNKIPAYHIMVEIVTTLLFVFLFQFYGFGWQFLVKAVFSSLLFVIAIIDWRHLIIPNSLIFILLILASGEKYLAETGNWFSAPLGFGSGMLVLLLPAIIGKKLTGRESMGIGDIKLAAVIGLYFGWQSIFLIVWFAGLIGAFYGISKSLTGKTDKTNKIPFGFFLCSASILYLMITKYHWDNIFSILGF